MGVRLGLDLMESEPKSKVNFEDNIFFYMYLSTVNTAFDDRISESRIIFKSQHLNIKHYLFLDKFEINVLITLAWCKLGRA